MRFKLRAPLDQFEVTYAHHIEPKIKADANEAYYTLLPETFTLRGEDFNRYPDSDATALRCQLADYYDLEPENLLLSNGSSQILEMLFWSYCGPKDKVLTFDPGFSMFDNYVGKASAELIWIPTKNFVQDIEVMERAAMKYEPKVILICNPNNPSGYLNTREEILDLVEKFPDILIIIDEAYSDFSEESVLQSVVRYPNLLVTKTLSKAMGLANLRLGFVAGNRELIREFLKVKLPFNVGGAALTIGEKIFPDGIKKLPGYVREVGETLDYFRERMEGMGYKVYPTGTNFIFGKPPVEGIGEELEKDKIYIRVFHIDGEEYHRITAVSPEERKELMDKMEEIIDEKGKL